MRLQMNEVCPSGSATSDKRLSRFFDEAEQLAAEKFTTPDGARFDLPLLIIFEECEGLARQRGMDHDADLRSHPNDAAAAAGHDLAQAARQADHRDASRPTSRGCSIRATARRFGDNVEKFGRLNRAELLRGPAQAPARPAGPVVTTARRRRA
jgi:hypothetical protein